MQILTKEKSEIKSELLNIEGIYTGFKLRMEIMPYTLYLSSINAPVPSLILYGIAEAGL